MEQLKLLELQRVFIRSDLFRAPNRKSNIICLVEFYNLQRCDTFCPETIVLGGEKLLKKTFREKEETLKRDADELMEFIHLSIRMVSTRMSTPKIVFSCW